MTRAWTGLCLALLAMTAAAPLVDAPEPQVGGRVGREVGNVHPDVVLPSLDGKKAYSLSQFRGKKVLLVQFASW